MTPWSSFLSYWPVTIWPGLWAYLMIESSEVSLTESLLCRSRRTICLRWTFRYYWDFFVSKSLFRVSIARPVLISLVTSKASLRRTSPSCKALCYLYFFRLNLLSEQLWAIIKPLVIYKGTEGCVFEPLTLNKLAIMDARKKSLVTELNMKEHKMTMKS